MEESLTGKLESMEIAEGRKERNLKDGTTTKKFIKFRLGGYTYNFFDMDWYKLHPELFQMGKVLDIVWIASEYEIEGKKITSRVARAVVESKDTFQKASMIDNAMENANTVDKMKADMVNAWTEAHEVASQLKKADIELNRDDLRSTAISLFIEGNRSRSYR